jgi:hypothetical protein
MEQSIRIVYPGNMDKYNKEMKSNTLCLRSVALTKDKRLALEVAEGKMLSIILADPARMVVEHTCRFMDRPGTAGCKHLACALDIMAFFNNKRLVIARGQPLARVVNINRHVKKDEVVCCRDITPEYLAYRGMTPKQGEYKLLVLDPSDNPGVFVAGEKPAGIFKKLLASLRKAVS